MSTSGKLHKTSARSKSVANTIKWKIVLMIVIFTVMIILRARKTSSSIVIEIFVLAQYFGLGEQVDEFNLSPLQTIECTSAFHSLL